MNILKEARKYCCNKWGKLVGYLEVDAKFLAFLNVIYCESFSSYLLDIICFLIICLLIIIFFLILIIIYCWNIS